MHGDQTVEEALERLGEPFVGRFRIREDSVPPRSGMANALRIEPMGGVGMNVTSVCQPSSRGFFSGLGRLA